MALRDWFIKDLGWKLFSVVLAVAIWLTVYKILQRTEPCRRRRQPRAPLTFDNVPVLVVSAAADVRDFRVNPQCRRHRQRFAR